MSTARAAATEGHADGDMQCSIFTEFPGTSCVLIGAIIVLAGALLLLLWYVLMRRRAHRRTEHTLSRYRELANNIGVGVWMFEADMQTALFVSNSYAKILGSDSSTIIENGNIRRERVHPEDREAVERAIAECTEESPSTQEYRVVRPDGEVRWVVETRFVVPDGNGGRARIAGTTEDITERRETEEALREKERVMSTLFSNLPGMAYRCRNDENWTMEFVSEGVMNLTGYPAEYLQDNCKISFGEMIVPEDRERVWNEVQDRVVQREPFQLNYRITTATGEVRWMWETGRGVFNEDGTLEALEGIIADDSERQRALNALSESEQRNRALVERSPIPIIIHSNERITYANAAAASALGAHDPRELLDMSIWLLAHPDYHDVVRERVGNIYARETTTPVIEERFRRVDGTYIDVEVSGATIAYGGVRASQVVFLDITKRKQAEAERAKLESQLRQSQKMEAIGQLAGGVAHDFNNILTAVIGHLGLAREAFASSVGTDHAGIRSLNQIERAADRAAALTRRLLTFSRKDVGQPQVLDLNAVVNDSRSLLSRVITEDIELEVQLAPELKHIVADANQIEQVLLNLVVNARDAMPDGGKLIIKTSNAVLDSANLAAVAEGRPGPHVLLTVSDTGCGMPHDVIDRIFEPFFTTKDVGEGSGLGLAMVHGIVQQCGGHVVVYSEPDVGSTFRICIPATDADVTASKDVDPANDVPLTGDETILVCEDDGPVRALAARMLAEAGYNVLIADGGARALELARKHEGPIHLLLTDVIMPRMNGRRLAESLARERPDIRTLYISGYTADVIAHRGVLDPDIEFLEKPFSQRDLLRRVRDALNGGSTPAPKPE
ncbi:MAG: PAS domain S-box protein [Phycisphaerales bacterium]|nr:PAS domain S-box protein [Phycisphaerales bacterium]